ncbi:MAG: dihydrodipicolinate synthase family protein [Chloroflexi bacterium]|nr:dihydrodipicolinate synthase family protein [Chloroflexota bacterium]
MPLDLHGLIPATVLPLTADDEPDLPALRRYLNWLAPQGPVALAINVDTGEGPHLTRAEKRAVLETVVEHVNGRCGVIAGIGGPSTRAAIDHARDARAAGADAMMIFPISAFFGQPLTPEIPYAYHAAIADAVELPMVLFQLQPALGGAFYGPDVMAALLSIDTVVAIKEASFDALKFVQMRALLDAAPRRITLLTGNDNFICHSFVLGADGALIGFGTLAVAEQVRMIAAARAKDWDTAFAISAVVQPLADAIFAPPVPQYRARTKEALVMLGALDSATVRPPLLPLADDERVAVRGALERAGLLTGASVRGH